MLTQWIPLISMATAIVAIETGSVADECLPEDRQTIRCFSENIKQKGFRTIFEFEALKEYCKSSDAVIACLTTHNPDCMDTALWSQLPYEMQNGCQGANIKPKIEDFVNTHALSECLDKDLLNQISSRMENVMQERFNINEWKNMTSAKRQSLIRFTYSMLKSALMQVVFSPNCNDNMYKPIMGLLNITLPPGIKPFLPLDEVVKPVTEQDIFSPIRDTVGIYAGLNLFVHDMDTLSKCRLTGEVTLLSNPVVKLTALIENLFGSMVISSVTINVYHANRAMGAYVASNVEMPHHFKGLKDGASIGENRKRPVDLVVLEPDRRIMINSTSKALVVFVTYTPTGYQVVLRMGTSLLDSSSGFLATGCTYRDELSIDINQVDVPTTNLDSCKKKCSTVTSEDVDIQDMCVHDCQTGVSDEYMEESFVKSVRDAKDMDSILDLHEILPTNKMEYVDETDGVGRQTSYFVCVLLCLFGLWII